MPPATRSAPETELIRYACLWARIAWTFIIVAQWQAIPGPWWAKALILVVLLVVPGGFDEVLFFGSLAVYRALRTRLASAERLTS